MIDTATAAVCCREGKAGYVVSSFEDSTLVVIVSLPGKDDRRILHIPKGSKRPVLEKAAWLRDQQPSVVITSAIDPYSLVALSGKGIEVRLVEDGIDVEISLELHLNGKSRLACNVIRPRDTEAC